MESLFQFKKLNLILLPLFVTVLTACVSRPPSDLNNVCNIFREYPKWYTHAKDVEYRWKVPVPVQMAIIHQESKFDAHAKPPRKNYLDLFLGRDLPQLQAMPKHCMEPGMNTNRIMVDYYLPVIIFLMELILLVGTLIRLIDALELIEQMPIIFISLIMRE